MKVLVSLAPSDLGDLSRQARLAEEAGVAALGIGDSPRYHDPFVALASIARTTTRIRLGPMVTNVVSRRPDDIARALGSVDELAGGGRVFAGLGAGDSALARDGLRPAPVAALRAGIERIRATWRELGAVVNPCVVVANGRRTLAMARETADAVVSGVGIDAPSLREIVGDDRAGDRVGAEPWVVVRMSIRDDVERAEAELRPLLASGANHVFRARGRPDSVPEPLWTSISTLIDRYDYAAHGQRARNGNAELVDRLGLRPYLVDRFAIVGSPPTVSARLRQLAESGVSGVVIPAVGLDVDVLLQGLGEVLADLDRPPGRRSAPTR